MHDAEVGGAVGRDHVRDGVQALAGEADLVGVRRGRVVDEGDQVVERQGRGSGDEHVARVRADRGHEGERDAADDDGVAVRRVVRRGPDGGAGEVVAHEERQAGELAQVAVFGGLVAEEDSFPEMYCQRKSLICGDMTQKRSSIGTLRSSSLRLIFDATSWMLLTDSASGCRTCRRGNRRRWCCWRLRPHRGRRRRPARRGACPSRPTSTWPGRSSTGSCLRRRCRCRWPSACRWSACPTSR